MADELQQVAPQVLWRKQVAARFAQLPTRWYQGSKTYNPPDILDGAQDQTTVTVVGATLGKVAMVAFSLDLQGITLTGNVSATDTVTATFRNNTGAPVNLGSGTLSASVFS